jgi:hypothetical protein
MYNLGVVLSTGTIYIPMPSRDASGGGSTFSAALEAADFDIHKNGSTSALTISTGTITINQSVGSIAGKNFVSIALSNDTDFTAGAHYQVWLTPNDETVDGQTVAECIAVFNTETNAQKAIRTFNESVYKTDVVVNSTANTTTAVDLQDFLDAQAPNDSTVGMLYAWEDSTGELEYFRVQSMTGRLATVEAWPAGGALSAAVAANDKLWPVQHVDINVTAISDDITAANNAESFFDGTGYAGTNNTIPTVTTLTGHTAQTGDSFARLGAPAGASVSADIATVDNNVDAILVDTAEIGAAGAGLTAVPWNAAWDAEVESEVVDAINASTRLTGIEGATFSSATDSLEAIRDRGDAAWTTGAGANPTTLLTTTIATLSSQTQFTLTAGSTDDDAYNGCIVVIEDASTSTQKAVGYVQDYIGATKTVTLGTDPGVFTMAATDNIDIVAMPKEFFDVMQATNANNVASALNANVTAISSDQAAANNLEADYDGTGYTKTNSTIGTVTTLTGHTAQTGDSFARLGAPAGASVSADIATVDTNVDAILVDTAEIGAAGAGLTAVSLAATGLDAVTLSEPSAVPVWGTVTAREGLAWVTSMHRNKIISNSTEITLRNDADSADIAAAPVTATTSSVTRGEYV